MRETVVVSWCDACQAEGNRTEGLPQLFLAGGKELEFDLCEVHAIPLAEAAEIAVKYGHQTARKNGKKSRKQSELKVDGGGWACDICGRVFSTTQGRGAHRRHGHGISPN